MFWDLVWNRNSLPVCLCVTQSRFHWMYSVFYSRNQTRQFQLVSFRFRFSFIIKHHRFKSKSGSSRGKGVDCEERSWSRQGSWADIETVRSVQVSRLLRPDLHRHPSPNRLFFSQVCWKMESRYFEREVGIKTVPLPHVFIMFAHGLITAYSFSPTRIYKMKLLVFSSFPKFFLFVL